MKVHSQSLAEYHQHVRGCKLLFMDSRAFSEENKVQTLYRTQSTAAWDHVKAGKLAGK